MAEQPATGVAGAPASGVLAAANRKRGNPFRPGFDPRRVGTGMPPGYVTRKVQIAREMLAARAEEIVSDLLKLKDDPDPADLVPCPKCGRKTDPRSDDIKIRALIAAMDRFGLGQQSKVEVQVTQDTSWVDFASPEDLALLRQIRDRALSARQQSEAPAIEVEARVDRG